MLLVNVAIMRSVSRRAAHTDFQRHVIESLTFWEQHILVIYRSNFDTPAIVTSSDRCVLRAVSHSFWRFMHESNRVLSVGLLEHAWNAGSCVYLGISSLGSMMFACLRSVVSRAEESNIHLSAVYISDCTCLELASDVQESLYGS